MHADDIDATTLRRFWDLSHDLLCVASADGRFREVNPRFQHVLGWTAEELEGSEFLAFVHPDDVDATLAEMANQAQGTTTLHFENRYRCRDGSWKWLSWTSRPEGDRVYAAARDVTERKEAQAHREAAIEAAARAESMGEVAHQQRMLLNSASHELYTPLTPILLHATRLQAYAERHPDAGLEGAVKTIQRSARRLEATIHAMLELSQLATERLRLQPKATPLLPVLKAVVEDPDVPLQCKVDLHVHTDAALLEQALGALVRNAATHGRGLQAIEAVAKDRRVQIRVRDDGPGFSDEEGENWFTPLYRGIGADEQRGAGLGLNLVRLVALSHGGTAGVQSDGDGKGTCAWIELPAEG